MFQKVRHHVFLSSLIIVVVCSCYRGRHRNFHRVVIRSDGTGYYEYLPAIIQYGDPWMQRIRDRRIHEIDAIVKHNLIQFEKGKYVVKYPMGVALLWLPFYLGAHAFSHLHPDYEANSYSDPYQAAVSVAATFYLIGGILLLYRILRKRFSAPAVFI